MVDEARGDTEAAHRRLDRLGTGAGSFFRGLLHAALDEQEAAFAAFEAVETWSYTDVVELRYFYPSLLDPLRREARFDALLDTVDQRRAPNPTAAYRAHAG
jgi:hypothetical protein